LVDLTAAGNEASRRPNVAIVAVASDEWRVGAGDECRGGRARNVAGREMAPVQAAFAPTSDPRRPTVGVIAPRSILICADVVAADATGPTPGPRPAGAPLERWAAGLDGPCRARAGARRRHSSAGRDDECRVAPPAGRAGVTCRRGLADE
jgi:hypothetical protein